MKSYVRQHPVVAFQRHTQLNIIIIVISCVLARYAYNLRAYFIVARSMCQQQTQNRFSSIRRNGHSDRIDTYLKNMRKIIIRQLY